MPPKVSKKAESAAKKKAVEDKTFGLKNKNKSSKVNKYVQQVQSQVNAAGNPKAKKDAEDRKKTIEEKKRLEEQKKAELAELFKPVQAAQKVPFGVDPKTILCSFFKVGQCQKGAKCKFSHDVNVERKAAKVDLYTDKRDTKDENMETWDQAKLEEAVNSKHGAKDNLNKPTDIVCKYFIEAIESRKYGWFWECPNGAGCKYRHALPPGFVLKKKETEEERREREERERENQITIEDFLETERHKLGPNTTPVTAESFARWKADRKSREAALAKDAAKAKQEAYEKAKAGMKSGMSFSGRELFDFNPDWAEGDLDDDEGAMDEYIREESEDEAEVGPSGSNGPTAEYRANGDESGGADGVRVAEDLFAVEDIEDEDDDDDE